MDSYLSSIDNYIQEDEKLKQQQLYYIQQEQLHQQQQQPEPQSSYWSTSFVTHPYGHSVMPMQQQPAYIPDHLQRNPMSPSLPPITCTPPGTPIKIRKKPGRRPNPASPAHRKEQNRAAQRAFRERKERRLLDLETALQTLQEQHQSTGKELKRTKRQLEASESENQYLKGVLLTLQFMCMHHNIEIPPHSPHLSEEVLAEMVKTHPHSVKAYIKAYTKLSNHSDNNSSTGSIAASSPSPSLPSEELAEDVGYHENQASTSSPASIDTEQRAASNTRALQQIQLQIRLQSTLMTPNNYQPSTNLQPTPLQQITHHDPRIDLIPCPKMRDRMIIFRDQIDYDNCFTMILNDAIYLGGDPTRCENWELPPLFYGEYWFLCSRYDLVSARNAWYPTKHSHSKTPSCDTDTTASAPTTPWQGDDFYSSAISPSLPLYRYNQQQPKHSLYDTSSSESLDTLSHLRL